MYIVVQTSPQLRYKVFSSPPKVLSSLWSIPCSQLPAVATTVLFSAVVLCTHISTFILTDEISEAEKGK